jgi:plastocyanin
MGRLARAGVVSLAGWVSACGGDGYGSDDGGPSPPACTAASATPTASVSLAAGNQFVPSCIRIAPGGTITFTNTDTMVHTVTTLAGQPETFDSGNIAPAGTFTRQFANSAETVAVRCTLHAGMTATVIVQ